jgi:hypothetical protein
MTLEEEINKHIQHSAWNYYTSPIERWQYIPVLLEDDLEVQILYLIEKASVEECLTSPSNFIREHKVIMEQKKKNV